MDYVSQVLADVKAKNPHEPEFLQTVEDVLSSLEPVIDAHPEYEKAALLERMGMAFKAICDDPDQLQDMVNRALSDGQDETPGMQL